MKTILLVATAALLFFSSCSTHKQCGDATADKELVQKLYSKRYKEALNERDSLCQLAGWLQKDTAGKGNELRTLQSELDDLQNQYNTLKKASGAEMAKLSDELSKKQRELSEKEKLLAEKEQRLSDLEKLVQERDQLLAEIMGTLRKALEAFPKDELNFEIKNGKIYISMMDKLLFKSGSATVEARGVDALNQLAPVLKNYPDIDILIEGHTDNIPIKTPVFKDNWDLSTYRATSVLRILLENNINVKQLTASGKGEFSPVASNATPEGRTLNRRTELILAPKLDLLYNLLEKN